MNNITLCVSLPPSVNHYYTNIGHGRKKPSAKAEAWLDSAGIIAQQEARKQKWLMTEKTKVVMWLNVFWPDARRRDCHNLHKAFGDAFEGVLYDDDRYVLIRDLDFRIDRKNPRVEVKITWLEGEARAQ